LYLLVPPRHVLKSDRDNVPPNERVIDRQGSHKLLDAEVGGRGARPADEDEGEDAITPIRVNRAPSAVAMAISHLGRRHSM
ncbi:hypothetical protein HKX48_003353, partial [Thoreauomyces humboldtii]